MNGSHDVDDEMIWRMVGSIVFLLFLFWSRSGRFRHGSRSDNMRRSIIRRWFSFGSRFVNYYTNVNEDETGESEMANIRTSLRLLLSELESCLPAHSEGLADPPAKMIRKSAIAKVQRLLDSIWSAVGAWIYDICICKRDNYIICIDVCWVCIQCQLSIG